MKVKVAYIIAIRKSPVMEIHECCVRLKWLSVKMKQLQSRYETVFVHSEGYIDEA